MNGALCATMNVEAPKCATKMEIGALFDEFLSLNQPYDVVPNQWVQYPPQQYMTPPLSPASMVSTNPASPEIKASFHPAVQPGICGELFPGADDKNLKRRMNADDSKCKKKLRKDEDDSNDNDIDDDNDDNDSDSVDASKKARRRKQNRVAAQTSREKKKKYLTGLEHQVQELSDQTRSLQAQLAAAMQENRRLRGQPMPVQNFPIFPDPSITLNQEPTLTTCTIDQPITVKTEPIIAFESAVFKFSQPSEAMKVLIFMISLALAMCKAPSLLALLFVLHLWTLPSSPTTWSRSPASPSTSTNLPSDCRSVPRTPATPSRVSKWTTPKDYSSAASAA